MDHFDGAYEEGAVLSIMLYAIAMIFPVLQDVALVCTILVAAGTLFLNRQRYANEFKKTKIYKRFRKDEDK